MAELQQQTLPQQYINQLGKDYGQQLAGLTSIPLDTSQFAPQVAGQDPLQTQAATLAGSGVGAYAPYLSQAATQGTQAIGTMGGVSPYISAAAGLTGTGAGTGAGSIASYMSPYQSQVIDASLAEFDRQAAARQQGISDQAVAMGGMVVAEKVYNSQNTKHNPIETVHSYKQECYSKVMASGNRQDKQI